MLPLLEPWLPVQNAESLQRELVAEVGRGHPLFGRSLCALAVRRDSDDVLFVSTGEPLVVAVVHLTYANHPEPNPRWPETTLFPSLEDWLERGMNGEYDAGGGAGAPRADD